LRLRQLVLAPDLFEFTKEIRENAAHQQNYIMGARCKKSLEEKIALLREYLPSDAPFLAANNPEARIRFYLVWSYYVRLFGFYSSSHLVTLCPVQYVVPLSQAASFNLLKIQAWAAGVLRSYGLDFIGIVEPAFYSNGGPHGTAVVSFHVHVVVFNGDENALDRMEREINQKYDPLIVGRKACDVRKITPGTLATVAKYMAKDPNGEYRAYEKKDENDDLIVRIARRADLHASPNPQGQKTRPARPGLQLKIHEVTRPWHLDKMIFAGGDAGQLLADIRKELKKGLPWAKRAARQHEHSGAFANRPLLRHNSSSWVRLASGYHDGELDLVNERAMRFGKTEE
jgi:hypothetical protein